MSEQREALRLADEIEGSVNNPALYWQGQAAAELRRLHALCEEMGEALSAALTHFGMDEDEWSKPTFDQMRAALAKWKESK